ncbi:MAG: GNAT family N-acetyltransferase [Thermoleophilia bacterium]
MSPRIVESPPLEAVLAFCAEAPVERVFLEDVARRGLGRFLAVAEHGRIRCLCHVGANIVPSGPGIEALARLASRGSPRMMVGEQGAVDALWEHLRHVFPRPLDDRPGQPVFTLRTPPPAAGTGLRAATLADLELLVPACAAAYHEEVGIDAYARDPELFRWRTRSQVELGRSWLWVEDGVIRFKAEASAWTPEAVQLQQVWVDPSLRGLGYARRAFADLCRLLLERTPTVCLFARPDNAPALALYDGAGMERTIQFRSLIFS